MRQPLHFALYNVGLAKPQTQTSAAERDAIARYATNRSTAAEIGVWHGVTTRRIAGAMASGGVVYAVDNYVAGRFGISFPYAIARRNTRPFRDRVKFVRATGKEAAAEFAKSGAKFDFVFIDGDHSYDGLRTDWESWTPLIALGGIVALHDSRSSATTNLEGSGSVIYTREVVRKDERFTLVEEVDTLTVLRRIY